MQAVSFLVPLHLSPRAMAHYAAEQAVAIAAVRRACTLTAAVFNNLVKGETLVKGDKSPVTGMPHLSPTATSS
jgi:hypothetical protein